MRIPILAALALALWCGAAKAQPYTDTGGTARTLCQSGSTPTPVRSPPVASPIT
jgi:hypothetical protein